MAAASVGVTMPKMIPPGHPQPQHVALEVLKPDHQHQHGQKQRAEPLHHPVQALAEGLRRRRCPCQHHDPTMRNFKTRNDDAALAESPR
jgi:hypothetical protein